MRIFIIGPDGCGKSTAAWLLSNELLWPYAETGEAVIQSLAKVFAAGTGDNGQSRSCWAGSLRQRKMEFRRELKAMGDLMTDLKATALIDACISRARIIVGVRRVNEAENYVNRCGWDGSTWIRVERPGTDDSGFELRDWPVHYRIGNERSLKELQAKLSLIAAHIEALL